MATNDDIDYNAPHEWELIENPWVLIPEDEYRSETCPCGLTEDFDCPECVADMDQPLCYLDPMIDDVRNERY